MPFYVQRPPQDDDELWYLVDLMWGIRIPKVSVCPGHCAPFDAFADAYFARSPVSVWKASRGFGGKSFLLSTLTLTEAVVLNADVNLLGGSGAQSQNIHEHTARMWDWPGSPTHLLQGDPTKFVTVLNDGNVTSVIKALMASQRSVRGPHPQRLRLDEIDEMELAIAEAAQGQPMEKVKGGEMIESQTVMSSTHQYPDKTMTEMLKRAREKGWGVFEWCYRESMGTDTEPGWLRKTAVDRKRAEIPQHMWDTEYDLQEPSFAGRAIDTDAVERYFVHNSKGPQYLGGNGEVLIFEKPEPNAKYCTGVDWAKEQDWTVVATFRTDVRPWRVVAWSRVNRLAWPVMVNIVHKRLNMYGGILVHDATGVGDVVDDMLEWPREYVKAIKLVGRERELIFNDYISAIENDELRSPRIEFPYGEHKYVTWEDLFGGGKKNHPPDSFVAGAMAWHGRDAERYAPLPGSVTRAGASPYKDPEHGGSGTNGRKSSNVGVAL